MSRPQKRGAGKPQTGKHAKGDQQQGLDEEQDGLDVLEDELQQLAPKDRVTRLNQELHEYHER